MGFDGESCDSVGSGRARPARIWVEKVVQGEATPRGAGRLGTPALLGRHLPHRGTCSRRGSPACPYEMTDDVIENLAEEVLGTQSKTGLSHLHWLFEFAAPSAPPTRSSHDATPNVDAVACESFLYNLALQRPWYELTFGGILGIENQIPPAVHPGGRRVQDPLRRRPLPRRLPLPHDPHLRGRGARWPRRRVRRALPRHRGQATFGTVRVLRRRRADPAMLGCDRRRDVVTSATDRGYGTVHKAMAVVSAFSYSEPVLGVSELSRRLGLGKSTVHRILATLLADGFVEQTRDERYRLSIKMYDIGQQVAASIELPRGRPPGARTATQRDGRDRARRGALRRGRRLRRSTGEPADAARVLTRVGRRRPAHEPPPGSACSRSADRRTLPPSCSRLPAARTTDDHLEVDAREGPRDGAANGVRGEHRGGRAGRRVGGGADLRRCRRVRRSRIGGRADHPHPPGAAREARADRPLGCGERLVDERRSQRERRRRAYSPLPMASPSFFAPACSTARCLASCSPTTRSWGRPSRSRR